MIPILAALPIKPFGVAKARLSPVLDGPTRSRLGRAIAARTASLCAGADVHVITADDGVAAWAKEHDLAVIREEASFGRGLDGAARAAMHHAAGLGKAWLIVHADLPVATEGDLELVFAALRHGPVVVPSHDGGTNLVGGTGVDFRFSYGPGSFHRHLATSPAAAVLSLPRLALDLDTPRDLERSIRTPTGAWLQDVLGSFDNHS